LLFDPLFEAGIQDGDTVLAVGEPADLTKPDMELTRTANRFCRYWKSDNRPIPFDRR